MDYIQLGLFRQAGKIESGRFSVYVKSPVYKVTFVKTKATKAECVSKFGQRAIMRQIGQEKNPR